MSAPELRPPSGPVFDVAVDPRLLEDCLGETSPKRFLRELTGILTALEGVDQDNAVMLVAYLARHLLDGARTTAEKAELLEPVLDAYRAIEGPHLAAAAAQLILHAYYVSSDDYQGVAVQLDRSLERELAAGPAIHTLGPLLQATETAKFISPSLDALDASDPRSPKQAIAAMQNSAEQAIPIGIELGLGAIASSSQGTKLRDGLYLLQDVFLAGSPDSAQLLEASPRVLDALARLDPRPIERSGLPRRPIETLLAQTESRLRAAGALDRGGVPIGGHTAPEELRRRFGISPLPPGSIRITTSKGEYVLPPGSH